MADAVAAAGLDNLKIFDREDRKWRRLQLESVLHRKRVFVPKVDPRNPFRQEGQLMDQYELRELNRNPRLYIESQDRSQSLRRVYRSRGHSSTSPRGYVDHLPASASAEFKATLKRAVPLRVLNPGSKKKGLGAKARLMRDVAAPISNPTTPGRSQPSSRRSSKSTARKASTTGGRRGTRGSMGPGTARSTRSQLRRTLAKSSTAPAGLHRKPPKGINDMAPSAPSFGHRPQSASRHFDALSMRANRLDRAPVGRLEIPNDSPQKQLNAKYGVGLLKSSDLAVLLSGGAAGAREHVPPAGMTEIAGKTAARLLWKTSHAAAHPPAPKDHAGSPAKSKRKKKRGARGDDAHFTASMLAPPTTVTSDNSERAQAATAAKGARARAHRGVVPPPTVGVGSGFGVMPEVVVPRFQVTAGSATPGGFLSQEYAAHIRLKTAERAGDDVRKHRKWTRQRARDVEMLKHLQSVQHEPLTMLDSAGFSYGTLGDEEYDPDGKMQDASSIFSASDDGRQTLDTAPTGDMRYVPDTAGSMFTDAPGDVTPAQYDAETDTWIEAGHQSSPSVFSDGSGGSGRRRRRRRGKKGKRRGKSGLKSQVALETGWDDSPHYMTPASWERIAAAKTRNQERTEYRTTAESLAYYARRAAGALETDTMFCSAKYERDKEEANDDLMRLQDAPDLVANKRTYLRRGSAAAITPRDMGDEQRFTVDAVLRQERHEDERRKSVSRTNDRRMSVGLPPLSPARRNSTASAVSGARSVRSGGRSARSGYSGVANGYAGEEDAPAGFSRRGVVADGVIPSPPPSEAPSRDHEEQPDGGDVEGDSAVLDAQQLPFAPVMSRVMHLQNDTDTIPGSPMDDSRFNIFAEPDSPAGPSMVDEGTSAMAPPDSEAGGDSGEADLPVAPGDDLQRASGDEVEDQASGSGWADDGGDADGGDASPQLGDDEAGSGAQPDVADNVAAGGSAPASEAAAGGSERLDSSDHDAAPSADAADAANT